MSLTKEAQGKYIIPNKEVYDRVERYLKDVMLDYVNEPRDVMSYTIPYLKSRDALESTMLKPW